MAIGFDEVDDVLVFSDDVAWDLPDGDWTIATWLYIDDNTGSDFQYFVSTGPSFGSNSYNIFVREASADNPDKVSIIFKDGDVGQVTFDSTWTVDTAQWMHVTVKRDGSNIHLIRDGDDEDTATNNTIAITPSTGLHLGSRSDLNADRFLGGRLAEFAIWDRALSAGEISALASGATPPTLGGMQAYVPLLRSDDEVINALSPTPTGTTVEEHPRVFGEDSQATPVGTAASGGVSLAGVMSSSSAGSATVTASAFLSAVTSTASTLIAGLTNDPEMGAVMTSRATMTATMTGGAASDAYQLHPSSGDGYDTSSVTNEARVTSHT